jgi:hypothetical protein
MLATLQHVWELGDISSGALLKSIAASEGSGEAGKHFWPLESLLWLFLEGNRGARVELRGHSGLLGKSELSGGGLAVTVLISRWDI